MKEQGLAMRVYKADIKTHCFICVIPALNKSKHLRRTKKSHINHI